MGAHGELLGIVHHMLLRVLLVLLWMMLLVVLERVRMLVMLRLLRLIGRSLARLLKLRRRLLMMMILSTRWGAIGTSSNSSSVGKGKVGRVHGSRFVGTITGNWHT